MIKVQSISQCRFGAKPDRRSGCHVRGGSLNFDIRKLPALLMRERNGTLGAVLFHDGGRPGSNREANDQLDEALARFARLGFSARALECALLGGHKDHPWQLDAWRSALRARDLKLCEYETGGSFYRQIFFDVASGTVEIFQEAASAEQGNPGKAALSLKDSTQVFRAGHAEGVVANATRFFRETRTFQGLKEWVVPEHEAVKPGAPFRLWSACCSNGVEAYSYAMFLHRLFQRLDVPSPFQVAGTDINEELIETARAGVYRVGAADQQKYRDYFNAYATVNGESLTFGPEIRRFLAFRVHDIKKPPRKLRFQVIICANVFQYYKDDARQHFLNVFAGALESPGYLYVGPIQEELAARAGLAPLGKYGFLYRP